MIGVAAETGGSFGAARGPRTTKAQDAIAVHQQPHGGAAPAADTRGGPQADARSKPAAGRRQPAVPAKCGQTRYVRLIKLFMIKVVHLDFLL